MGCEKIYIPFVQEVLTNFYMLCVQEVVDGSKLLYKMGQDFMDILYTQTFEKDIKNVFYPTLKGRFSSGLLISMPHLELDHICGSTIET